MANRARRCATFAAALCVGAAMSPAAQATTIPDGVTDMTGGSSAEITFPGGGMDPVYSPKLLAVGRSGLSPAALTWSGSFGPHPLRFETPGVAGNSSGSSAVRNLRSGRYAYYCQAHGGLNGSGMSGVVYVAGPRASLTATPADIAPGGTVTLDAGATDVVSFTDTSATYAFDPEGDGTFLPASAATSIQATYPAEGSVAPRVRVTAADGRIDEAVVDVDVAPQGPTPPPQAPPPGDPADPGGLPGQSRPLPAAPRAAAVKFADVATLPRFGRCVNRASGVRIRVRDSAAVNVRSVRVLVNGRTVRSRSSVRRPVTLAVRPLPRGRPLVKVVVTLAGGKKLSKTTRYRTCRG